MSDLFGRGGLVGRLVDGVRDTVVVVRQFVGDRNAKGPDADKRNDRNEDNQQDIFNQGGPVFFNNQRPAYLLEATHVRSPAVSDWKGMHPKQVILRMLV
jgi:hypothetical protein